MTKLSDERLGIVRLNLPDGREVALQWTWAIIDRLGHDAIMTRLRSCQKGGAGVGAAAGELLEAATAGAIQAKDVVGAPAAVFPVTPVFNALWRSWELAQYGPDGRPAEDGATNPPKRRTLLGRLFRRR